MGENRRLVVIGGVVGALVLAFALWHFVLDGGGGGSDSATGTTIPGIAATTPLPSTTAAATPGADGSASGSSGGGVSVDIVTNPFLPKYVAPTVDTSAATTGAATGVSTGGTTVDTSGSTVVVPPVDPGTAPTGTIYTPPSTSPANVTSVPASGLPTSLDQNIQTIKAVTVQLLSVQTAFGMPAVTVKLGDKTDTVVVGQTFETSYRLLGVTDRCGTFVYGDSPFQVCIGETAAKQ